MQTDRKEANLRALTIRRRTVRNSPKSSRAIFGLIVAVIALLGGCGVGTVGAVSITYSTIMLELPKAADLASRPLSQVTRLYDRTGTQLLYEFYEERRFFVPIRDVAPIMVRATLAAEDVNFYSHPGFDVRGLTRAMFSALTRGNLSAGVVGGSTITQQIVKRVLLTSEQTLTRKLREIILAVQVERIYSKDEVLELYLNQVFYGNQSYGIEAAARAYFAKSARDLNLAEATILAGLVQAPSEYDPIENPRGALRRQSEVLDVMVRYGMVTREEAEQAGMDAEAFVYQPLTTTIVAPHFAFFAREQLTQRVNPELVRGGLSVRTTIDLTYQDRAQGIVSKQVAALRKLKVSNGSLVAIDPVHGEILALVGSADFRNVAIDGQVNVATSFRQPGSSFKPIAYAALFATGKYVPASTVLDEPFVRPDSNSPTGFYRPANYDRRFHGTMTLRTALANSFNIPALLVQETVGTRALISMARQLGIATALPEVQSLVLGAGTVRLLDMTSAYGVFANRGVRLEATPFLEITDLAGRSVFDANSRVGVPVLTPETAYMVTSILAENRTRYPTFGTALDLASRRVGAVKTGTTNDFKDSLTIGYTPSLAVGVWVGNTDSSPMQEVGGSAGAGGIWKEFMDTTLRGRPVEDFAVPGGIELVEVCGSYDLRLRDRGEPTCAIGNAGPLQTPQPTPILPPE